MHGKIKPRQGLTINRHHRTRSNLIPCPSCRRHWREGVFWLVYLFYSLGAASTVCVSGVFNLSSSVYYWKYVAVRVSFSKCWTHPLGFLIIMIKSFVLISWLFFSDLFVFRSVVLSWFILIALTVLIAVLTKVITLEQLSWSQRVVVASVIGVVPGLKSSVLVSVKNLILIKLLHDTSCKRFVYITLVKKCFTDLKAQRTKYLLISDSVLGVCSDKSSVWNFCARFLRWVSKVA